MKSKSLINDLYLNMESGATIIPNWKGMTKTQLANGYLDAKTQEEKDGYYCALVCKFWYMIYKFYNRRKTIFNYALEDFIEWVYEGINKGLKYASWRNKHYKVSTYEDGAAVVFNKCFQSVEQNHIRELMYKKRVKNVLLFSDIVDINGDLSLIDNEYYILNNYEETPIAKEQELMNYFVKKNKLLGALLLNKIITNSDKLYKNQSIATLVNLVLSTKQQDLKFLVKYHISDNKINEFYKHISVLSMRKCKRIISTVLKSIRENQEVQNILWN